MAKYDRQMQMINLLINNRRLTCGYMANYFGVSVKTIKKDVCDLSLYYPIVTYTGKNGGVELENNFIINGKTFDRESIELIVKGLKIIGEENVKVKRILDVLSPDDRN